MKRHHSCPQIFQTIKIYFLIILANYEISYIFIPQENSNCMIFVLKNSTFTLTFYKRLELRLGVNVLVFLIVTIEKLECLHYHYW